MRSLFTAYVVALVLVVAGCSDGAKSISQNQVQTDSSSAFTFSGEHGLVVTGAPGVAPPGTSVKITPERRPLVGEPNGAAYLGRSVEIVLGDNVQPGAPIDVSAPAPDAALQESSAVFAVSRRDGAAEFIPVTVHDAYMMAQLTHLSPLDFFKIDFKKIGANISSAVHSALTHESASAPSCLGKPVTLDGVTYTADRTKTASGKNLNAVWPCLRAESGRILLDLEANGNRAWLARTRPDVGGGQSTAPSSGDATASGLFALYQRLAMRGPSTGRLMPDTTLTFGFDSDAPPSRAEVKTDVGLMLMSAAMYEVTAVMDFAGLKAKDKLDNAPETYDCILSASDTVGTSSEHFVTDFASAFKTAIDCLAAIAPGPMAFMLGVLGSGAGVVSGLLTGAFNEAAGSNLGIVQVRQSGQRTANKADFIGRWTGHTRLMNLNADGSATVSYFNGAMNGEEWSASWTNASDGITVTLKARTSKTGSGLNDYMQPGLSWTGVLEKADKATVMKFSENPGDDSFYWCNENKYGYDYLCGA